jgi:hypothetical protein
VPKQTAKRPWEARIRHVSISGMGGRVGTFKTPEAAIAALYASPEFQIAKNRFADKATA